jgi:hypothetical protein
MSLITSKTFLDEILDKATKPLMMTEDDTTLFKLQSNCHICRKSIPLCQKVRDHDHLTGEFRGAAHAECNLNLRLSDKIPVVFHNLKSFDGHILIQGTSSDLFTDVSVIPQTLEKYISISMDSFIFIDSLAFLSSSLDTLAKTISDKQKQKQKYLAEAFPMDKIDLLMKRELYLTNTWIA